MGGPKRHHTIPILHLKHFVGSKPKGHVWTVEKDTGKARSGTPENTAVQSHFYSAEKDDGSLDTGLEDGLAKIEGVAAPIYERLLEGRLPLSEDKATFAAFLAIMYLRTPAVRRDAAEVIGRGIQIMSYAYGVHDKAFEGLIKRMEKERGRSFDETGRKTFRELLIDPSRFKINVPKERTFMVFGAMKALIPILSDMNWCIVRPTHGFFITSDNPVVRWADPKTRHPILGDHGFHNKTAEVTFPLSPKVLLMAAWQDLPNDSVLDRDNVWSMNKMRASHADQYLFAHSFNSNLKRLATRFKGSRPLMTTQGFGPEKFGKVEVPRRRR